MLPAIIPPTLLPPERLLPQVEIALSRYQEQSQLEAEYADALEHNGRLHVIYAVNKEDIEISSYDLAELLKP